MKKILIALLLALILTTATACDPCSTSTSGSTSTCSGSNLCCGPSFDVNSQVCVQQPGTISPPACLIPTIGKPCVVPPTTTKPCIEAPDINVCSQVAPCVVAPPTIVSPTLVIPNPVIPKPCNPTPPPVPPPCGILPPPPPPVKPIPPPPTACTCGSGSNCQLPLSNVFTLSLQYACRKNVALESCLADVLWNNKVVFSIVPGNHSFQPLSVVVYAQAGQNSLQIEGAGKSDSYGLIVDNVKLIRQGTTSNIVVNGGFEQPNVGFSWGIFNSIPGWSGVGIEVGYGTIYYNGWNSQVIELDGNANYQITQVFNFDANFQIVSGASCDIDSSFNGQTLTYKLEFDFAARKNGVSSPFTSRADVIWNNVVVASLNPSDYLVKHSAINVQLRPGQNVLSFDGASYSDSYGLLIDNVKLTSVYNSSNLIINGGFETPYVGGVGSWNSFSGGVYGWSAVKAELGHANSVYNSYWPASTGQCAELDSDSNQRYTQKIIISQMLFTNLLVQQAAYQGSCAAASTLASATCDALHDVSTAIAVISGGIQCKISMQVQDFNNYLCQLYHRADAHVNGLLANQELALSQYDCLSDAYTSQFGHSNEVDFDDSSFDHTSLDSWEGWVEEIAGKVIKCHDGSGHHHWLQIAPCTHFEGQFPAPKLGAKIFWKGKVQPCGKTYVKWATTCNC